MRGHKYVNVAIFNSFSHTFTNNIQFETFYLYYTARDFSNKDQKLK